ncbi:MAG TPA: hypothetical protein VI072_25665 [Polyangiaceae bacterium]
MSRWVAYTFGLGLAAAVVSPGLRGSARDSYPLSTYPMFAARRDNPRLYIAEAVAADGSRSRLEPDLLGTDEVMQAAALVRRAVQASEERMQRLCADIAERVRQHDGLGSVRYVELTSAEYEPIAYFVRRAEPDNRVLHIRCAVQSAP